jgi:hypothetical protein
VLKNQPKTLLEKDRRLFEDMLRSLTSEREKIKLAMAFTLVPRFGHFFVFMARL